MYVLPMIKGNPFAASTKGKALQPVANSEAVYDPVTDTVRLDGRAFGDFAVQPVDVGEDNVGDLQATEDRQNILADGRRVFDGRAGPLPGQVLVDEASGEVRDRFSGTVGLDVGKSKMTALIWRRSPRRRKCTLST